MCRETINLSIFMGEWNKSTKIQTIVSAVIVTICSCVSIIYKQRPCGVTLFAFAVMSMGLGAKAYSMFSKKKKRAILILGFIWIILGIISLYMGIMDVNKMIFFWMGV